jgi:hypothetical protein
MLDIILLFFILLFSNISIEMISHQITTSKIIITIVISLLFAIITSFLMTKNIKDSYMSFIDVEKSENPQLLQITPSKMCMGGNYMYQGDSQQAIMCQQLEKEKPEEIKNINCGPIFKNQPRRFYYENIV